MAQYDVFRDGETGGLILDVQTDLLEGLNSRIVVPLVTPQSAPKPARRLNPVFVIEGREYVMLTQFIGAMDERILGKSLASLVDERDEITAALDMVFFGF